MMADRRKDLAVELKGVHKNYAAPSGAVRALTNVDCRFDTGVLVGVVGRSGSGKSTLLNVISGIDRPSDGEVWVGGAPVHSLPEASLAAWRGRNVGVVFQFFQLLPTLTVAENVMLPMDFCNTYPARARRNRALSLLEHVGVVDQADKLTLSLSGGQQQRAAIARALANDPPLIVADEPTGNLDFHTGQLVWTLFLRLAEDGKTVVVATHDSEAVASLGRVISLSDGAIVSDGPSMPGQVKEVAHE